MSERIIGERVRSRPAPRSQAADPERLAGGWAPEVWLGATAPGGLALPDAHPTPATMYAPRGVHLDDDHLVVTDSGNHRVLIWRGVPTDDQAPCDVVLGQPDATSEGPGASGRGPEHGMCLPTGVLIHDGRLLVADAWHHRILVWDSVPTRGDTLPDLVLGQPDAASVLPNRGAGCDARSMYWPFGVAVVGGRFYVADTGNRRVLGWSDGVPTSPQQPADLVLGQPDEHAREENRGASVSRRSFRWPHDLAGTDELLFVADAGNHRVLGWQPHPPADRDADLLLGQLDFESAHEFPYGPQSADRFRFPYAVSCDAASVAIADTANNRVLIWRGDPATAGCAGSQESRAPQAVLGQSSFADNGENRWTSVDYDTLCWPYGIALHRDRIAIADSGNNRVMIWRRR